MDAYIGRAVSNAFNTTATKLGKNQTASPDESIREDGSQTRGDTLQSNDLSPEDAAIMKNAKARLAAWLQSLSDIDRKILALTKAGKKLREVGEAVGKSHEFVRQRLAKLQAEARKAMEVSGEFQEANKTPYYLESFTDNIGTFDPNNLDIRYQGEDVHRGVTWQDPVSLKTIITLFEKADSSTLIHEIAHYWNSHASSSVTGAPPESS